MNLPAWEACFPYSVDALDKGPFVILNYHICFFFFFRTSKAPPTPPPHTLNYSWVAGLVEGKSGKVWGISCDGVTLVSLGKVRESNNGPPPPQGGFGVHGCLCVKQRVSQTCVFIKLLPCSQNKDTWVHPGFCLQRSGNRSEAHRRGDGGSNEHEQRTN